MVSADLLLHGVALSEEMQVDVGDPRRTERIQKVVEALSRAPDKSYPQAFENKTELEGIYRLIDNAHLSVPKVLATHLEKTAERSRQLGQVLVIHDTKEVSFSLRDGRFRQHLCQISSSRQGFWMHTSLVASADGLRAPLGVVGMRPYVHEDKLQDDEARAFWAREYGQLACESDRWLEAVEAADSALWEVESVVHVMDREGDIYELLERMRHKQDQFVIRAAQNRKIVQSSLEHAPKLFDAVAAQPVLATRTVELSPRSVSDRPPAERKRQPARGRRWARLQIRSASVELLRPQKRRELQALSERVAVNVVEVVEVDPPQGEEPVYWLLLTSEPIDTVEQLLWVVDAYRSRWLIAEFFKAIGTGCGYNKRQLNTAQHLLLALALTLPVAWKLLVMRHLERQCPEAPAQAVVSETQLLLLKQAVAKWRWSAEPTVREVTGAIARLGGHLKSNGRPGWLTLGRGYQALLMMESGWEAAMQMMHRTQQHWSGL